MNDLRHPKAGVSPGSCVSLAIMKDQPTPYEALANYFPDMMVAAVDARYRLVFVDGDEWRTLGVRKETVEGSTIEAVEGFSTRWKSLMIEYTRRTLAGEHLSYEIRHRHQVYRVNTIPLRDDSSDHRVLFVFTNITEQKRTETEMLNALKKERELGELKSRFVSMASHEWCSWK